MTTKPVLRVAKIKATGKSTPQSVMDHYTRAVDTPNADPSRTHLNRWLVGSPSEDLAESIRHVLDRAGIDKVRPDAVLANDIVMSVSPEWFRPDQPEAHGTWDEARLKSFEAEALAMLKRTFGARLVLAVLHLDEATPHVQAVVVPVLKRKGGEGHRLSSKDMFGPTQLTQLQQDWEDRLTPHGVGPRTKGSRARHTTLREYYGAVQAFRAEDGRDCIEVTEPPPRGLLEGQGAHRERVGEWRKAEAKRIREELHPLAVEASRGRLYDAERRSAIALRGELAEQGKELGRTRVQLSEVYTQLDLSKEQVAALRRTPINAVAAALGFTGLVGPKENAIDLTRRVGELDYHQAVQWLVQRFGPGVAATAVREHAEPLLEAALAPDAPVVKPAGQRVKERVVSQQLSALAAPAYRVTLMEDRDGKHVGRNLGRTKGQEEEKLFTDREVLELIPRLTSENARGAHVYVTPVDPDVHHILVDDLSDEGLTELDRRGYKPAVVLETSPGNHQALLKLPKSAGPWEAMNIWFKDLNRDIGDMKITGPAHPFRLAGFENRKSKHLDSATGHYPFVRLVSAVNQVCARAIAVVRQYATLQPALTDLDRGAAERSTGEAPRGRRLA